MFVVQTKGVAVKMSTDNIGVAELVLNMLNHTILGNKLESKVKST